MAGFGLKGVEGRILCPYCGSTDCCGIKYTKRGMSLICIKTNKIVTEKSLRDFAKKQGLLKCN